MDFTHQRIRFYAMRRRDPHHQPLLRELPYLRPNKPFQGKAMSVQLTLKLCHVDVKQVSINAETCPITC